MILAALSVKLYPSAKELMHHCESKANGPIISESRGIPGSLSVCSLAELSEARPLRGNFFFSDCFVVALWLLCMKHMLSDLIHKGLCG